MGESEQNGVIQLYQLSCMGKEELVFSDQAQLLGASYDEESDMIFLHVLEKIDATYEQTVYYRIVAEAYPIDFNVYRRHYRFVDKVYMPQRKTFAYIFVSKTPSDLCKKAK